MEVENTQVKSLGDLIAVEKAKLEANMIALLQEFSERTGLGVLQIRYTQNIERGFAFRPNEHQFELSVIVGLE